MKLSNCQTALGAIRARSGVPFEITDRTGAKARVMHIDGDTFELRMKTDQPIEMKQDAISDMLFFLQGAVEMKELDAVSYEVGR
jgi:hypothetical protein